MNRLAIIPARGGSKRLPGKNIVEFRGKPIINWTIEEAEASECFDNVLVSTEDAAIRDLVESAGGEVIERSEELASDKASLVDVGLDVLEQEAVLGRQYDVISFLYATAPLRRRDDIAGVVNLVKPGVCDFAMAITRYAHPPHQGLVMSDDGTLQARWPEYIESSEAEFGRLWVDNGSTYAMGVEAFCEHKTFYGPGLRGWPMPFVRSIDIDEREDLELARYLASIGDP